MPTSVPVHYGNLTTKQFTGWQRATVDVLPTANGGSNVGGSTKYLLGQQRGSVRSLSLYVTTTSGQKATVDLNSLTGAAPIPLTPTPAQLAEIGQPVIAGVNMTLVESGMDGMFWTSYWRARVGTMFVVHLWTWWVPGQGWAEGTMIVQCSNPSVTNLDDHIPSSFVLAWSGTETGTVYVPGITPGATILTAGTRFANGQCRAYPVVVAWSTLLSGTVANDSADAVQQQKMSVLGVQELWPDLGNPVAYTGFDPASFLSSNFAAELTRLHDWTASPHGIIAHGTSTGGEGDQIFVGEYAVSGQDSLLSDKFMRLVGLLNCRRPCHHAEADGSLLNLYGHPNLRIWQGIPFYQSTDQLGKTGQIGEWDGEGVWPYTWFGPWVEHWLCNSTAIACRITGDPGLQWILRNWMRISYWDQSANGTTNDGFWATRAAGYEGIFGYHCHYGLWDETERAFFDTHKLARLNLLVTQVTGGVGGATRPEMWQVISGDTRLIGTPPLYNDGTGRDPNWLAYQQGLVWGTYLLARTLGHSGAMAIALTAATSVVDRAFAYLPATNMWDKGWDFLQYDGLNSVPLIQGAGAHRALGQGTWVWHFIGLGVVLWDNPNHARAKGIADAYLTYTGGGSKWMPPNLPALLATSTISNVEGSRGAWKNVATEMEAL